ncbi:phosphoglucosamine mutase [bacterium BMS3Abin14]|nr:phosphoglucosamine mutase [bacterium BMS3Abin14]
MTNKRELFGTDGVRGEANRFPIVPEVALKLGMAAGVFFHNRKGKPRIIIGKDTRLSGYMIESALMSGICSMGTDVYLVGPMPTPAIAFITRSMRADAGIIISASHNPFQDNGIKFFGRDGMKLPDADEAEIEHLMDREDLPRPTHSDVGRAFRLDDAEGRYIVFAKSSIPRDMTLDGLKIVVDCAHGATYKVAPAIFSELGADVITIGDDPDGMNINLGCGSTNPEFMARKVVETGADLGLALDGDGDRVILADSGGEILDGDDVLFICASRMDEEKNLSGRTMVGTVMTNMGLESSMKSRGIRVIRAPVGDRYVLEEMISTGAIVGGEPSGHIIFLDHTTTGDGIITALQVLRVMVRTGRTLSELKGGWVRYPQVMRNLKVQSKPPLEEQSWYRRIILDARDAMGDDHLLSLRYSGTEPLLRVTVSCASGPLAKEVSQRICDELTSRLGCGDIG